MKYGKLSFIEPTDARTASRSVVWRAVCDCGNEVLVALAKAKAGEKSSCGCLRSETSRTNGKRRSLSVGVGEKLARKSWEAMLSRCTKPKHRSFNDYGGRGISVCERWMRFEEFYRDMGDRPAGYTLDRIDNSGDYEKTNCRWTTRKEQAMNRRPFSTGPFAKATKGVSVCTSTQ